MVVTRSFARSLAAFGTLALAATTSPSLGQQPTATLGIAAVILADGSPPWEDRPINVARVGVISGTASVADPGDDLGPSDGVVRTYDSVTVRFSYSAMAASPEALALTAELPPSLAWPAGTSARLSRAGCPGGAVVKNNSRTLVCSLGEVEVPPAVSGMVEAVARVRGSALHGTSATITATVAAANGQGDPDPVRCPEATANGCRAVAGPLRVSAGPGVELVKRAQSNTTPVPGMRAGVRGWSLTWTIVVYASGDGDARGNAALAPVVVPLHDWWAATRPDGAPADVGGSLIGCDTTLGPDWACVQPGGEGAPVVLNMPPLDPDVLKPTTNDVLLRSSSSHYAQLSRLTLSLFVPEDAVARAGGRVTLRNCAATPPGDPATAELRPLDAAGNPNLGGLPEPLADNCAQVTLIAGHAVGPRRSVTWAKRYGLSPAGLGEVVAGDVFEGEVVVANRNGNPDAVLAEVSLCDAFDNETQRLHAEEPSPAHGVLRDGSGRETLLEDGAGVVLEFAAGPWGTWAAPADDKRRAWANQSGTACDDPAPVNPAGWVALADLDPTNTGKARLDVRDVNLVRARFVDPVAPNHAAMLRVRLRALPNPSGTYLINYGAIRYAEGTTTFSPTSGCYGRDGDGCPDPPRLDAYSHAPGELGDALILVEAPTRLRKLVANRAYGTDLLAGDVAPYMLAAQVSRSFDLPLPPGIVAEGVGITDVLPAGLDYVPGSAKRAGEDINRNGVLDPREDVDGNGRLDPEAPLPPVVEADTPAAGQTRLTWSLGALPAHRNELVIHYAAVVDPLLPGGSRLANRATIRARGEPDAGCEASGTRHPERCAAVPVVVANRSMAAVDKRAAPAVMASGHPVTFQLRAANLTSDPIEWFDAVDILPWVGDGRTPPSDFDGRWNAITVTVSPGPAGVAVWASAADPSALDRAGGSLPDGMLDPVAAYGDAGAGLGTPDWPCLLEAVGTTACAPIGAVADVTALRFWAPDPDTARTGDAASAFLPLNAPPRTIAVALQPDGARQGDVYANNWGGRFEGLVLPVFHGAAARVRVDPAYLPWGGGRAELVDEPCTPRPVDVVLVLDASTSMRRPSGAGGTKLEAVVAAAEALVGILDAEPVGHRVAVVGFNNLAWTAQPLTADQQAVLGALEGLAEALAEGTRLDLGLLVGGAARDPSGRARQVMVLLSDGLPNRVPTPIPAGTQEDTVLRAAMAVRRMGMTIHTIGYGRVDAPDLVERIHPELLAAIAGPDGTSAVAADPAALVAAFGAIGADLTCPVGGP